MPVIFGGCSRGAHRQAQEVLPGLLGGCSPGCSPRYSGDAQRMFPGMLPRMSAGARGSLTACSPRHLGDAPGMLGYAPGMRGGCSGVLTGLLGRCQQAARGCWLAGPALPVRLRSPRSAPRSAPRAAAGGAAGPEGGSGAGRGWRLQPGSPAGQAPLTRLLCKLSSPVPHASLTSSPPAGKQDRGVPGPLIPGGWHRAGSATSPGTPHPGTLLPPPGSLAPRRGTGGYSQWPVPAASGLLITPRCARAPWSARPVCFARLGARVKSCGRAGDVAWEFLSERVGTGVPQGGMGRGPCAHTQIHTCEGPGILNCIADKSPT